MSKDLKVIDETAPDEGREILIEEKQPHEQSDELIEGSELPEFNELKEK